MTDRRPPSRQPHSLPPQSKPRPTRRRFLGVSAAGAAALSSARWVHSQEPTAQAASPNAKMHVAIIGCGGRGGSHIEEMLRADNATITHICEVDASIADKRAAEIESKQGSRPKIESDVRRLLDEKSLDVVTIATPNHWHALGGIWAMQAGKDAYIEKPVCHNIAEGSALIAAAEKYGRMCQVGTQCRSSQACIDAVKFIAEGGIGDVRLRAACATNDASRSGHWATIRSPAMWISIYGVAQLSSPIRG